MNVDDKLKSMIGEEVTLEFITDSLNQITSKFTGVLTYNLNQCIYSVYSETKDIETFIANDVKIIRSNKKLIILD